MLMHRGKKVLAVSILSAFQKSLLLVKSASNGADILASVGGDEV